MGTSFAGAHQQVAQFVKAVVLVLTPDQRTKLASRLRESAAHRLVTSEYP
jgi:hypothetical protein